MWAWKPGSPGRNSNRILNGDSWILPWYQVITVQPYTYENLPQAPPLLLPSSMSALPDGCPVHTHDSLLMCLVSIHLNYLCHPILDHPYCTAISMPLDNGYFTCFVDLLVSNAPLHSDVVLGVDWLSIVCTATLYCCISLPSPKSHFNYQWISTYIQYSRISNIEPTSYPSSFINGLSFILHHLSIS